MFLFSRVAVLQGSPDGRETWLKEMTHLVNEVDGPEVALWEGLFGMPLGTYAWSALVQSRAHWDEFDKQTRAMPGLLSKMAEGADYMTPTRPMDYLRQLVWASEERSMSPVGTVAEMITATPAPGRMGDVLEWGPQISGKVAGIIKQPTSFFLDSYGTFGQVTWNTSYPDFTAVDEAQNKLMMDTDYLGEVAKGSDLFVAGSGERVAVRRIA